MMLAEIVVAAAHGAGKEAPSALAAIAPTAGAEVIAASLLGGQRRAILLGNFAVQHADAAQIAALAQALAALTGATLGVLTEAANTVGGYAAGALPQQGGRNARAMLGGDGGEPCRGYVLVHAEPEFDCARPAAARAALQKAEFVVVLSPFRHALQYADVLLPIAAFTETAGTFVNCEGRVQGFHGVVPPAGEVRPGWKVLRVLATILKLPGFEFETSEAVRDVVLAEAGDLAQRLSNATRTPIAAPAASGAGIERVADVPIYFADPLVRRAPSLQQTADARPPKARVHRTLLDALGIAEGAQVRVKQGGGEAVLATRVDPGVPPGVVRIAAAHSSTCGLEGMSGPVTVERA
jgi:NADH-quinone oxidoreductase subunit G